MFADWNDDLAKSPRSFIETRQKKSASGKTVDYEVMVHRKIISASKCGKVFVSYWIPDEQRWCGYTKDSPPIAWQPWPEHPHALRDVLAAALEMATK